MQQRDHWLWRDQWINTTDTSHTETVHTETSHAEASSASATSEDAVIPQLQNPSTEAHTSVPTETSHAEASSASAISEDAVIPQLQNPIQNQAHTSVGQANNIVNEPIICEISDEEELLTRLLTKITHENLNSPNEANCDSKTTSIDEKIKQIANLCRENRISNNAVEILHNLQSGLVVGRDLEISSPDECPEGITKFIMVDRQNLLKTAFEEIGGLSNKLYTLEVQLYNEVYNLFDRLDALFLFKIFI